MMIRFLAAIAAGLMLAGCVTTTTSTRSGPPGTAGQAAAANTFATDPCANRLHDIAGAILQYYAVNKHLPAALDELKSMTDLDTPLDFTCPVSHEPYVYEPSGLSIQGGTKVIILHDALPSHNGGRWCLLMAPTGTNAAQSMEVVLIPEPTFRAYLPVIGN